MEDSQPNIPDACFIRAPVGVAEVLRCEVADAFSCLMVTDAEELISRVIRVKVQGGANLHFPVTVAVPFCTRYRGHYRDIAVKIVDGERMASYITPVTTEGTYGGHRVKFHIYFIYKDTFISMLEILLTTYVHDKTKEKKTNKPIKQSPKNTAEHKNTGPEWHK